MSRNDYKHASREQIAFARDLRRNATDAEILLWSRLRRRQLGGHRFRRQHPIGKYIADFACIAEKLVIELDGGQHAELVSDDDQRTQNLEDQGFRVIRFWNQDVLRNLDAVLEQIAAELR